MVPLEPTISFSSTVLRVFLPFAEEGRTFRGIPADICRCLSDIAEVSLSCKHRLYVYESAHILDRRPAVVKVNATLYPKSTPEGKVSRQDDEIFFL